jgi:hypothetical protein
MRGILRATIAAAVSTYMRSFESTLPDRLSAQDPEFAAVLAESRKQFAAARNALPARDLPFEEANNFAPHDDARRAERLRSTTRSSDRLSWLLSSVS